MSTKEEILFAVVEELMESVTNMNAFGELDDLIAEMEERINSVKEMD